MRILHLSMLYPPHVIGGAERSVAMLAEAQAAAGDAVFAACTTPGAFAQEARNGVTVFRMPHETRFWAEDWPDHNAVERLWRKAAMPFNRGLRAHFERVLDIVRPDIVHTHSMVDVSTSLWPAAARKGYPVVHTLRDYDLMCVDGAMYHGGKGCGAKCRILSLPKQRHHRFISAVAANSAETLRLHRERGLFDHVPEARRRVIWNIAAIAGAERATERPRRDGEMIFGYFGRINREKGVGTLIDAARVLCEQGVRFRILVGGKADKDVEPFRQAAADLPIEFLGFVDAATFFSRIDVLVIPSIWAEPLPRTGLEAYAAAVPVLGSRSGGTPDIIGHDNEDWLFDPGDDRQLAVRMEAIIAGGRDNLPDPASFSTLLDETKVDVVVRRYRNFYETTLLDTAEYETNIATEK